MKPEKNYPICEFDKLECIFESEYYYPGNEIESNLLDLHYVRLWILFKHILPDRTYLNVKYNICKNCGFIFTNPRMKEKDIKIKFEIINKLKRRSRQETIVSSVMCQ